MDSIESGKAGKHSSTQLEKGMKRGKITLARKKFWTWNTIVCENMNQEAVEAPP